MSIQALLSFQQILIYLDNQWLPKIKDALQKWVAYTYHDDIRCPLCTRSGIASKFCIDCDVPIDKECVEIHQNITPFLKHSIIDITACTEKFKIKHFARKHSCSCHKKPQADFFCSSCKSFKCEKCVQSHNRDSYTIVSLQDIYLLLDSIHDLKRSLEDDIRRNPTEEGEKNDLFKTAISWIEAFFGINNDFPDVCSVPVHTSLSTALVEGKTSPKTIIMTISQLKKQLDTVKRELCQIPDPTNRNEMESACEIDQTHEKQVVTDNDADQINQNQSNESNVQPYLHQQPDEDTQISGNHDRPIDKEIRGLQQAQQHQLNLDSFVNLHKTD